MKTEILSIGTELTTGQNLDTNSQWLSLRLAEIGIAVGWHTTIADDLADNLEAVHIAVKRAQLVVITGGLGPTLDDLTREVLAQAAGVDLVLHEPSLLHIKSLFERRQRPMPERNKVQAFLPRGAEPIDNPLGTAPGIWMQIGKTNIVAMPGVPSEMFAMFENQVKPRLLKLGLAGGVRVQRKINTFGAGESQIEEMLGDVTRRGQVPEVGITAHDAVVSLRIFGTGATLQETQAQIAPVEQTIRQRLGNFVYGVEQEELQDVVLRLLGEKKKSLATAESITGGLIAQRLVQVPGASTWFRGGVVAYDSRVKVSILDVSQDIIDRHALVSPEVAQAMAVGCRRRLAADIGVGTTGYAGPTAAENEPVGLAYIGLAWDGGAVSAKVNWLGTRVEIQSRTAKSALNMVRLHLLERREDHVSSQPSSNWRAGSVSDRSTPVAHAPGSPTCETHELESQTRKLTNDMSTPSFLDVRLYRLDPMRAEVRLRLRPGEPAGELRGRLMGPRCRFTSTVEIAYPVRPISSGDFAIVVPEPSLWTPAKPFVYEGPIERLAAGGATETERLRLCFRSLKLGPAGLVLNGKALSLLGKEAAALPDENELLQWRGQGFNLLLCDQQATTQVRDLAMNLGFLLVLRESPGDNGQESLYCLLEGQESARLKLPGMTRRTDGSFTLGGRLGEPGA